MLQRIRFVLPLCAAFLAVVAPASAQKTIVGNSSPTLSPAVKVGDLLFVSGQLGRGDSIQAQTTAALDATKRVVEQAGSSMDKVVKCTVFLVDLKDFAGMNQAYAAAFPSGPPARSTVVVAALVSASAKLEIECIASLK